MGNFGVFGTVVGAIASVATVIGFISVKPLPSIDVANGLNWCSWSSKEKNFVERLADYRGQIVMVSFRIDADIVRKKVVMAANEKGPDDADVKIQEDPPTCDQMDISSAREYEESPLMNGTSGKFFELPESLSRNKDGGENEIQISERDEEGEVISYKVIPNLILPIEDVHFVNVEICESYCYSLTGPVFIREVYNTEGNIGIGLIPIDIHKNSYITSRFECRQEVNRSNYAVLGWIKCLI